MTAPPSRKYTCIVYWNSYIFAVVDKVVENTPPAHVEGGKEKKSVTKVTNQYTPCSRISMVAICLRRTDLSGCLRFASLAPHGHASASVSPLTLGGKPEWEAQRLQSLHHPQPAASFKRFPTIREPCPLFRKLAHGTNTLKYPHPVHKHTRGQRVPRTKFPPHPQPIGFADTSEDALFRRRA